MSNNLSQAANGLLMQLVMDIKSGFLRRCESKTEVPLLRIILGNSVGPRELVTLNVPEALIAALCHNMQIHFFYRESINVNKPAWPPRFFIATGRHKFSRPGRTEYC